MAHRSLGTLLPLVGMAFALVALPGDAAEPPDKPPCLLWRAEARYVGFAYDHWVHLRNGCAEAVDCEVSTDVHPTVVRVAIAAHDATSVLTYRASPARTFRATVRCTRPSSSGASARHDSTRTAKAPWPARALPGSRSRRRG